MPETPPDRPTNQPDQPESYEAARDELVETVRLLEAGGTTLEESIALWERGEVLADACQRWLDGARSRLEAASGSAGGAGSRAGGGAGGGAAGRADDQ